MVVRPGALRDDAAADDRGRPLALLFGMLGPPVIWAARFMVSYTLVPVACRSGSTVLLHLVTGVALAATAAAGLVAWRRWRQVGGGTQLDLDGAAARTRFMAITGMLSSALFIIVTVAEWLASVMVHPCQSGGGAPL